VNVVMNFGFPKIWRIFLLAEYVLAFQAGLLPGVVCTVAARTHDCETGNEDLGRVPSMLFVGQGFSSCCIPTCCLHCIILCSENKVVYIV
jgi:hypothetical protein